MKSFTLGLKEIRVETMAILLYPFLKKVKEVFRIHFRNIQNNKVKMILMMIQVVMGK